MNIPKREHDDFGSTTQVWYGKKYATKVCCVEAFDEMMECAALLDAAGVPRNKIAKGPRYVELFDGDSVVWKEPLAWMLNDFYTLELLVEGYRLMQKALAAGVGDVVPRNLGVVGGKLVIVDYGFQHDGEGGQQILTERAWKQAFETALRIEADENVYI